MSDPQASCLFRAAIAMLLAGAVICSGCNEVTPSPAQPSTHESQIAPQPTSSLPETKPVSVIPAPAPTSRAAATQRAYAPATSPAPQSQPDPDFLAVQRAAKESGDKPQLIVLACAQYLAQHPASPLAGDAQTIADNALDVIWWRKIDQLCQRRQDLLTAVAAVTARIASQTRDDQPPPALVEQRASLQAKLADTTEQLRGMRYLSAQSPPLSEPASMARLRTARDPQVYEWWKKLEIQKIKDSGSNAW